MTSRTTTEMVDGKERYRKIPCPTIPAFPVLSGAGLFSVSRTGIPSLFQSRSLRYFTAGRYAIYQALKESGVRENDEILVPAYHCEAMIHPVLDAGCIPVFYKISKDFSVDINDMEGLITDKTKMIIAVNYFGFGQNIHDVRKICDQNNLKLIEDCAHSLFGSSNNVTVGQTGDYAIGSTKKFFPVFDGGILACNNGILSASESGRYTIKSEIRFIYNTIERSLEHGRLWIFSPLISLIEKLRHKDKTGEETPADEKSVEYSPENRTQRPARISMLLEKYVSHHRIFVKRRENYKFLVNGLKENQYITLPLKEIPPGTVPYMLPVIIENLEKIFPDIEDAAIPFQRFGQFLWQGSERCPVSQRYAKTIIQIPCHQELSKAELQWIIDEMEKILEVGGKNDN